MTDASELLPCPFCGGEADIWKASADLGLPAWIACTHCKDGVFCTNEHSTTEAGIAAWNRRAPDPRVAALVETLEGIRLSWATGVVKSDAQHTLILEDGSRHTGPAVDFLARLAGAQVDLIDAALAAFKGGANG